MKKGLFATLIALATVFSLVGSGNVSAAAPYKLPASYQAVYCYDTGSYWVAQKAAYPEYYATNDAYFRGLYGPGTMYCPN